MCIVNIKKKTNTHTEEDNDNGAEQPLTIEVRLHHDIKHWVIYGPGGGDTSRKIG